MGVAGGGPAVTTPIPPSIDEIPFRDPHALEQWILTNPTRCTPLAMVRLFEHHNFICVADLPTKTTVRCAVWRHKKADNYPELARFQIVVYYTDTLTKANVASSLRVLRQYRAWKLNARVDLDP